MQVGDLVRKYTSIIRNGNILEGTYNYGIVLQVSDNAQTVKVAWAHSNPKNPWMITSSVEVVNGNR